MVVIVSAIDETRIFDENLEAAVSGVASHSQAGACSILDRAIDDFDCPGD